MSDCARYEPTMDEIMADPTVHALMRADRVNVERLRLKLRQLASASRAAEWHAVSKARQTGSANAGASEPRQGVAWG